MAGVSAGTWDELRASVADGGGVWSCWKAGDMLPMVEREWWRLELGGSGSANVRPGAASSTDRNDNEVG